MKSGKNQNFKEEKNGFEGQQIHEARQDEEESVDNFYHKEANSFRLLNESKV